MPIGLWYDKQKYIYSTRITRRSESLTIRSTTARMEHVAEETNNSEVVQNSIINIRHKDNNWTLEQLNLRGWRVGGGHLARNRVPPARWNLAAYRIVLQIISYITEVRANSSWDPEITVGQQSRAFNLTVDKSVKEDWISEMTTLKCPPFWAGAIFDNWCSPLWFTQQSCRMCMCDSNLDLA